jgi:hypothetical protein
MDLSVEHEEEEFTQLEHTSTTLSSAKHEVQSSVCGSPNLLIATWTASLQDVQAIRAVP